MGHISNSTNFPGRIFLDRQPCVAATRKANLPRELKIEVEAFIQRNIIPECGRVAPNCLKAHMIKKAKELGYKEEKVRYIRGLFKSDVGYDGYYLDAGELKRV